MLDRSQTANLFCEELPDNAAREDAEGEPEPGTPPPTAAAPPPASPSPRRRPASPVRSRRVQAPAPPACRAVAGKPPGAGAAWWAWVTFGLGASLRPGRGACGDPADTHGRRWPAPHRRGHSEKPGHGRGEGYAAGERLAAATYGRRRSHPPAQPGRGARAAGADARARGAIHGRRPGPPAVAGCRFAGSACR